MSFQREGFDPPLLKEFDIENINESINKMSEMINLLLTEVRKLKGQTETND